MQRFRMWTLAGGAVAFAVVLLNEGCGSDDGDGSGAEAVSVGGNVSSVSGPSGAAATSPARWLALLDFVRPSDAVAQDSEPCPAADVLICLGSESGESCEPIDQASCQFAANVEARESLAVTFVKDSDQDGGRDEGEATAQLDADLGEICEGLEITLSDVAIDFDAQTASAGSVGRDPQECPSPTPTPQGTATPAPTMTPEASETPMT